MKTLEEIREHWEQDTTPKAEIPTSTGGVYVFLEHQPASNLRYSLYHYFVAGSEWQCSVIVQSSSLLWCVERLGVLLKRKGL